MLGVARLESREMGYYAESEGRERRSEPRVKAELEVSVFVEGGKIMGLTGDISRRGFSLVLDQELPRQAECDVYLLLPDPMGGEARELLCRSVVLHCQQIADSSHYRCGWYILHMPPEEREDLALFVERQAAIWGVV